MGPVVDVSLILVGCHTLFIFTPGTVDVSQPVGVTGIIGIHKMGRFVVFKDLRRKPPIYRVSQICCYRFVCKYLKNCFMYFNNSCCKLRLQLCQFDVQNFIRTAIIVFEQHKIFCIRHFFLKRSKM